MKTLSVIRYPLSADRLFQRLICILILLFISRQSFAGDPGSEYQKANGFYQKQQYDSAAVVFEQLISQEYKSAEVYYNLANCYYKLDNVSRAILNYERALKLQPDDEDAAFNLKVAQLKVVDKIETVPDIFYKRWMKTLSSAMTTDNWSRLLILNIWIMFMFAAVYVLSRRASIKRFGFLFSSLFLLISLFTAAIASQNYENSVRRKSAVIMSVSAYVKSSPGENNTDLFLLHEGTRVDILDAYENWVKIRIANGSIGWLRSSETEEI